MADGTVALSGGTTDSTLLLFWVYPLSFCLLSLTTSMIGRSTLAGLCPLLLLQRRLPRGRPEFDLRRLHQNHLVRQVASKNCRGLQFGQHGGSVLRPLIQVGP